MGTTPPPGSCFPCSSTFEHPDDQWEAEQVASPLRLCGCGARPSAVVTSTLWLGVGAKAGEEDTQDQRGPSPSPSLRRLCG